MPFFDPETVDRVIQSHDEMGALFDEHMQRRQSIDGQLAAIHSRLAALAQTIVGGSSSALAQQREGGSSGGPSSSGASSSPLWAPTTASPSANKTGNNNNNSPLLEGNSKLVVHASHALRARLQCDVELLELREQQSKVLLDTKLQSIKELRTQIVEEEAKLRRVLGGSSLQKLQQTLRKGMELEKDVRRAENAAIEQSEVAQRREEQRRELEQDERRQQDAMQQDIITQEALSSSLEREAAELERVLASARNTAEEWAQRVKLAKSGEPADAELTALLQERERLTRELQGVDGLLQAFRNLDQENSVESVDSSIIFATTKRCPSDDPALRALWEAAAPVRDIVSLRETLLVLKAHLFNLCDDIEDISSTVDKLHDEPQYSQYPPLSEGSNLWRQSKLFDTYQAVVEEMRKGQYETDANAAKAVLNRMKTFAVVYDCFETHFDAVANAILQSEGHWKEATKMLTVAELCQATILEARQKRRNKSFSGAPQGVGGSGGGGASFATQAQLQLGSQSNPTSFRRQ